MKAISRCGVVLISFAIAACGHHGSTPDGGAPLDSGLEPVCPGLSCDDSNACTVDSCTEPGTCSHAPFICPKPIDPCQIAGCDADAGCQVVSTLPDDTPCDDVGCPSATVGVCKQGVCTQVPRDGTGCGNLWVRDFSSRLIEIGGAIAYDSDRARVVMLVDDPTATDAQTVEWDGSSWAQVFPTASPPLDSHATLMAYDSVRHRTVALRGDQTWEYDGTTWVLRPVSVSPPSRDHAHLVFDAERQVVLLFGGQDSTLHTNLNDTWTWDGTQWTQLSPSMKPAARSDYAIGYDPARKVIVLHAGYSSALIRDTWEWNGTDWAFIATGSGPLAGTGGFVYDDALGSLLWVGDDGQSQTDLWTYSSQGWAHLGTTAEPDAHFYAGLVYDSAHQQVMMFGGLDNFGSTFDTWLWDGTQWSRGDPVLPRADAYAPIVYDEQRDRVVLFSGGQLDYSRPDGQTWEWDGTKWQQRTSGSSPPVRKRASMVYDTQRGVSVLFGGQYLGPAPDYATIVTNDTWEWDGALWQQRTSAHVPPARWGQMMAYDANGEVLLFQGFDPLGNAFTDTWEWDGNDWTQVSTPFPLPALAWGSMVYDVARHETVLLGAQTWGSDPPVTWVFETDHWEGRAPAVSPSSYAVFTLAYDLKRGRVVALGNRAENSTEMWDWDGTVWTQLFPTVLPPVADGRALVYDSTNDVLMTFGGEENGLNTSSIWRYLPPK